MTSVNQKSEISVLDLKSQIESGQEIFLLDVREAPELSICTLKNDFHIPLGDLPDRLPELDSYKQKTIVVYCRSGRRSQIATDYLKEIGFAHVFNLTGGILAWADQIDSSLTKY